MTEMANLVGLEIAFVRMQANDFGSEVIPGAQALGKHIQAYLFDGYWEDIGTIEAFYSSNLALTDHPKPAFRSGPLVHPALIYQYRHYLMTTRALRFPLLSQSHSQQNLALGYCTANADALPDPISPCEVQDNSCDRHECTKTGAGFWMSHLSTSCRKLVQTQCLYSHKLCLPTSSQGLQPHPLQTAFQMLQPHVSQVFAALFGM